MAGVPAGENVAAVLYKVEDLRLSAWPHPGAPGPGQVCNECAASYVPRCAARSPCRFRGCLAATCTYFPFSTFTSPADAPHTHPPTHTGSAGHPQRGHLRQRRALPGPRLHRAVCGQGAHGARGVHTGVRGGVALSPRAWCGVYKQMHSRPFVYTLLPSQSQVIGHESSGVVSQVSCQTALSLRRMIHDSSIATLTEASAHSTPPPPHSPRWDPA